MDRDDAAAQARAGRLHACSRGGPSSASIRRRCAARPPAAGAGQSPGTARRARPRRLRGRRPAGAVLVKLGQFLATRPDIVGLKVAAELEKLAGSHGADRSRDRRRGGRSGLRSADRHALCRIRRGGRRSLDRPGAPGAGALRRRRTRGRGQASAAGCRRRFTRDLSDMFYAARSAERFEPRLRRLRLVEVVETLARSVPASRCDFRARSGGGLGIRRESPTIPPPARAEGRLGPRDTRALTMEWIDGAPLRAIRRASSREFGSGSNSRGRCPLLRHATAPTLLHADMQGDFLATPRAASRRGPAREEAPLSRRSSTASSRHNYLRARQKVRFRGGLLDPPRRGFRPGDVPPPSASRYHAPRARRPDLDGQANSSCCSNSPACSMKTQLELVLLQRQ